MCEISFLYLVMTVLDIMQKKGIWKQKLPAFEILFKFVLLIFFITEAIHWVKLLLLCIYTGTNILNFRKSVLSVHLENRLRYGIKNCLKSSDIGIGNSFNIG